MQFKKKQTFALLRLLTLHDTIKPLLMLKSISYIFHPIIMPLIAVIFYFTKTPRFMEAEIITSKLISLIILTIILPIIIYIFLKISGNAKSINLSTTKERVYPLFINCIILIIILKRVVPPTQTIELYFFFLAILISNITCLFLAIYNFKASLHMVGVTGVLMFFIALSIHFSININGTLILMFIITGAVATSRLHLIAHTNIELAMGTFIGIFPQLILIKYWL